MVALIFIAFVLGCFAVDAVIQYKRHKEAAVEYAASTFSGAFNENSVLIPKGLYFDKTHTWAYMEKNGNVKIGMDDFLQHITGPITRIEMKNPEEKIKKGEAIFTIIQNGKRLNIYSPVSGTIKMHNNQLSSNSSIINESPYSDGWVYVVEPTNWLKETQIMMMAEKTNDWIIHEFTRLKDFLSLAIQNNSKQYAYAVLQDGGEVKDYVLGELGPEIWEDFQTNFIDTAK